MAATGRATKLTGAVGEFLVAAELCRSGLLATPFAGNVPHYDIIASGQSGGHVAVQVKAINGLTTWQFDIRKFVDVQLDGKRQIVKEPLPEPFPGLIVVLVVLITTGRDRFFILEWKELQETLVSGYKTYLAKHDGIRPRAPESFHTALSISDVERFKGEWDTILRRVPKRDTSEDPESR